MKGLSFHHRNWTGSGAMQPPIQRVPEALTPRVKWPGCEADLSPPSSAKVKNTRSYTSTSPCLHGMALS
jgi:hypothetical protein